MFDDTNADDGASADAYVDNIWSCIPVSDINVQFS